MTSRRQRYRRRLRRRYHGRRSAVRAIRQTANLPPGTKARRLANVANPLARSKVVIVAGGMRTGSTLLCELAESLPGVATSYEALNPIAYGWLKLDGAEEAADLTRDLSLRAPVTVTKVFRQHLTSINTDWDEYVDALPQAKWIQLYRHDVAAQFVSLLQAQTSAKWLEAGEAAAPRPAAPRPTVHLKVDALKDHFEKVVADDRAAFEALSQTDRYTQVRYEDFADDPATWAQHVLPGLLEVPSAPIKHQLKRQDPRDLSERLANPDVLADIEQLGLRWHPAQSW